MCCSRSKNTSSYGLDKHTSWGHGRETLITSLNRDNTLGWAQWHAWLVSIPTSQLIQANCLIMDTIVVSQNTASAPQDSDLFQRAVATMSTMKDAQWDAMQRRERDSVRQWAIPPLLLGAGKGATVSLHISPKGAWMRQLYRDMARIINTIPLCCYRWTNIALVGVQRHCSLQPSLQHAGCFSQGLCCQHK